MEIGAMPWSRARTVALAVGLLALGVVGGIGAAGPARADIIFPDPDDGKRVPGTVELDWGVFEQRVSRRHVVQKGETLRGLAKRYYDDAKRWTEIAEDNRHAVPDPNEIATGATIWIPPRTPPKDTRLAAGEGAGADDTSLAPRYLVFWMEEYRRGSYCVAARAGPGDPPPAFRSGGMLMLFEPGAADAALRALAMGSRAVPDASWGRSLTTHVFADTRVAAADPTVRVVTIMRLTGRTMSILTSESTRKRYGADGKRVTQSFPLPPEWASEAPTEAPADDADATDEETDSGDQGRVTESDDGVIRTSRDLPPDSGWGSSRDSRGPDSERWPTMIGAMVALLGLGIVAGVAYARRPGGGKNS